MWELSIMQKNTHNQKLDIDKKIKFDLGALTVAKQHTKHLTAIHLKANKLC